MSLTHACEFKPAFLGFNHQSAGLVEQGLRPPAIAAVEKKRLVLQQLGEFIALTYLLPLRRSLHEKVVVRKCAGHPCCLMQTGGRSLLNKKAECF